jgi:hypothetical protein
MEKIFQIVIKYTEYQYFSINDNNYNNLFFFIKMRKKTYSNYCIFNVIFMKCICI